MTKAREIMSPDPTCVKEDESLVEAAKKMADLDVGALPICGNDDRLKGMLTDRDIVVKCIAKGGEPISDVETHHRTMTACHLCNIGLMMGRELKWNERPPTANSFTCAEAAARWFSSSPARCSKVSTGGS